MAMTQKPSIQTLFCFSMVFLLVFIAPVYAVDLSSQEKEYLRTRGTIVFVSQTRYPPFEFTDAHHQHEGMMLDVVRWLAVEIGFQPVFTDMTFQQAQDAVLSGKADILTSLFYSDKREERFEFTETLFNVPASIFVRADRTDIKDLKDLNGKTIAIQRGDYAKEFLESQKISFDTLDTENFAQATDMVIASKADAVIGDEQIVLYHIFSNRLTDHVKKVGDPLYIGKNCMASNKSNAILIGILNKGIDEARKSGVLDKTGKKWLGTKYGPQESLLQRYFLPLSAVLGGLLLLSLTAWVWNVRLRALVSEKIEVILRREEALRESEERFRNLMEFIPGVSIQGYKPDGTVVYWNKASETVYGYTAREALGKDLADLIIPEDLKPLFYEGLGLAKEINTCGEFMPPGELLLLHKDGRLVPVYSIHTCVNVEGKEPTFFCIDFDLSERKRIEDELRESEEKYRELVEHANSIILHWTRDGQITFLNEFGQQFFGYSETEIIGRHVVGTIVPETERTGRDLRPLMDQICADPRAFENNINENICRNGERVWIAWTNKANLDSQGQVTGILSIGTDITKRKQAEEELRRTNNLLDMIIENIPNMIFLKDAKDLRFVRFNQAGENLLGYSREQLLGKCDYDFFPKQQADSFTEKDRKVLRGKRVVDIPQESLLTANRGTRILHTKKVPLFDADGEPEYLLGISEDITERKQADEERRRLEERLQRAEKMEALGTLAGGVAHDLNNVLGIVVGYSELLLDDLDESTSERSQALEIMKGGQRAAAIVQDLLTLARRGVPSRKVLNLNKIVMGCQESPDFAKVLSLHPKVEVKTDVEPDLMNVLGSSVHLEKSFMNLVSNAVEAMPSGGTLTVKTANYYLDRPISGYDEVREGDYVVLFVSDTGEGIPAHDQKHVFEPFYTKKVMGRSGTGLGLAVVWGTVKDHLGYINVESQEGKGATFTLYFPVSRDEMSPEEVSVSAAEYMGKGESILVVDDVREQRELATTMLRKLGYMVETVSSGEEAVEYVKQKRVDLIVLDMIMDPGMDGLDTYAKILEAHPHQKAVIVSGFAETERVSRAQSLGAGAYVKKPYVLEKLGLAVREELDHKGGVT